MGATEYVIRDSETDLYVTAWKGQDAIKFGTHDATEACRVTEGTSLVIAGLLPYMTLVIEYAPPSIADMTGAPTEQQRNVARTAMLCIFKGDPNPPSFTDPDKVALLMASAGINILGPGEPDPPRTNHVPAILELNKLLIILGDISPAEHERGVSTEQANAISRAYHRAYRALHTGSPETSADLIQPRTEDEPNA